MDAFDRKNRPPPHPLEGLESPFLDQELFAVQGEEEWEPRLGALEAASPFLGTFGLPGAGALPPAAAREEESPFPEPEAEAGFEGLFEAEGGITGEDDRTEVRDTTIVPYRWICSVTYEKDGRTLDGGSGLLISDRHVLTAAHVITEAGSGPSAPSLYVYPGRHYGGEPFGKFLAAKTRVPNFRMDFGLITLNRPVDPGLLWWGHPSTNTVWWSEALIPFQELRQRELAITTAGFPGAKDAYRRRMYEAPGVTVAATFGGSFRHTADTTQGQSGSPIWTERGGRRILIGIVRAFDQLPNQIGVFVHDRIVRGLVERWMAEDAPRPRPVQRRIALEIPYRWVCRLEVYDNDLRRVVGYGTGLLISDRHVLTSARVIHGFSKDRRRYTVRIAPGYEFGKEALGSATASGARVSPKFSPESKDASADYGVLTLSRPLGSTTFSSIQNAALGSWGGANHGLVTSAADWSGKEARIAAFSRASGGGGGYHKLRVSSGGIVGLKGGQILHRAGSKLDAPGGPIWVEGGGRRVLIGIASSIFSKESDVNWGCYLSQETLSHLREWLNEDFERKELEAGELFSPDELESFPASPDDEAEAWADEAYPEPELGDEFLGAGSQADDFLGAAEFAPQEQEEASGVETEAYEEAALAEPGESRELCYEEETPYEEGELEEEEFRVNRLPAKARQHFSKGGASWRDAVAEAMGAGIRNPNDLADIIFFMQHPERMSSGVGKPISRTDPEFFKLRAEWELCRTIAKRRLTPSAPCPVFLPAVQSPNYEQYVAAPTTGRITLMLNGRNSGGSGDVDDQTEAYDSMQETVESLGSGDSLFLAAWQLKPTAMDLTRPNPAGLTNWGELFVRKAAEGVRIRIIVSDMPPDGVGFKSDVQDLTKLVDKLPAAARDNLKFIVSMHPAKILDPRKFLLDSVYVATHHQKFMVVKKGNTTIAYCGGLDLSPPRTPKGWAGFLVWHDIHGKLEGRITGDLEREFILRWNREKDKSTEPRHPGWKTLESLTQAPMGGADKDSRTNTHKVQMLRTVSVGALPQDIRRDDIWQGYFRLIGCATRFLFMENQYFFEPKLADAIVRQAEAQPALIVIIVVSFETDDPTNPYTKHGRALQNEFFTRLSAGIPSTRLRVYTMLGRLVHSKLVLVDDQFLTVGSANANPRGFFMDTELNVMLDDADAVKGFRHKLWTHDLGLLAGKAASWGVPDFIPQWDLVAKFNDKLRKTPEKMVGERVVPFDPRTVKGEKAPYIPDVLSES